MLGPITNLLAAQAARKAAIESARKRVRDPGATDGASRDEDRFDSELQAVEGAEAVRRLADADQEDAREDREASLLKSKQTPFDRDGPGRGIDLSA
ncbi:MAG: hypothetical protein AB8F26_00440 [Phycisphaerales bacterium]